LLGHIVAIRPSHTGNCELTRQITAQMRKPEKAVQTFSPPPAKSAEESPVRDGATLDVMQVMKILPHRPPFLMVDLVTKIEGNRIVAQKNVTMGEPVFQGHFPGHPILPGVLQLEAMAQVAGILMMRQAENAGKLAYFMSAEEVKWRKPVRPGDVLVIDVTMTKMRGKIGKARGECSVNGEVVSEANVTFMLMDKE
jgi:UDP-3-O-[3-hydroxymyristoyl] N-acetylglucosamine deacetylase/3-hydroxyacyl-[acyl-carrier-protein] dehydratase